jgi:hypothetical protein
MYEFIQKFHSGWAYLALLLLIVAVVISLGCFLKKEFTRTEKSHFCFDSNPCSIISWYYFIFCFSGLTSLGCLVKQSRLLALSIL